VPKWVKAGLSVFIAFHLFCVILFPICDTPMGERLTHWARPYVLALELTNNWNFFSPNPSPPIYVDYELVDDHGEIQSEGRWPEPKDPFFWRDRQTRRITATDFMIAGEVRVEKMMVSYFCNQPSHPHSVRLWRAMESQPTAEQVVSGQRRPGDGKGTERKFVSQTFCSMAGGA
jgi:hypothetical protein